MESLFCAATFIYAIAPLGNLELHWPFMTGKAFLQFGSYEINVKTTSSAKHLPL